MTRKVMVVVGTRPEAVKLAPVVLEFRARGAECVLCSTGQHREMLRDALAGFELTPDVDLALMRPNQTLAGLTADLFTGLDRTLVEVAPDWVLVQGDTTTAMVGAMVGFYRRIRVGHVEAGLRTGDRWRPFPEEINRRIADLVTDRYYAPTEDSAANLRREGVADDNIVVTGNTVVDAVQWMAERPYDWNAGPLRNVDSAKPLVLVTCHRRESFGGPLEDIMLALRDLAFAWADAGAQIVFPVHLNPNVREAVERTLTGVANVRLLEPIPYADMIQLMKRAALVLTDSGGIQEEAPSFGAPVLVMRETTERPEGVSAGAAVLVGTDRRRIVDTAERFWTDVRSGAWAGKRVNPYGDGRASKRIVDDLLERA